VSRESDTRANAAFGPGDARSAEVLEGLIERVTYADAASLYSVLRIVPDKGYEAPRGAQMYRSARLTAVGKTDAPAAGMHVRLTGRWTNHPAHGPQFEFELCEVTPPADRSGLVKYLASDKFPGIGEKLAQRIVETLGENALEEILAHPEKLASVRGLKTSVRDSLVQSALLEHGVHRANVFLRSAGLGPVHTAAVVRKLGPAAEDRVRADPYVLASGIPGIGFGTADRIAMQLGLAPDDPRRARAALVHALKQAADEGHTLLTRVALIDSARELLGGVIARERFDGAIDELARAGDVVIETELRAPHPRLPLEAERGAQSFAARDEPHAEDADSHLEAAETRESQWESDAASGTGARAPDANEDVASRGDVRTGEDERASVVHESVSSAEVETREDVHESLAPSAETARTAADDHARVYLPALARCEADLAENLAHLLRSGPARPWASRDDLAHAERRFQLALHPLQRDAVLGLLATPVGLLTGGPGVGKTTIVRLLVALAEAAHARVALASPTGRAAKRLAEATGRDAQTVHRLLGWEPATQSFLHDAKNPLEADLVVVDEISMLDVVLAHHLVKAIQPPTRAIFVGDPNQLPSVGPGNVLGDLIASGVVPVHRLSQIYRQASDSLIVSNAHRILHGELPILPERGDVRSDFYFFHVEDPEQCAERTVDVVTRRIPDRFGFAWIDEVQVISPMYRGPCGVDALNERLREENARPSSRTSTAPAREIRQGSRIWREGDRVIHTRNDYEKEVFNGDMGTIARVYDTPEPSLIVKYPEREVPYAGSEISDLQPAFAITVHRSQGGEFPAVVIPLVTQHYMMLQRHLLYTAITRAKKLAVIVGSQRAVRMAIENADQRERQSALAERLKRALDVA
jgi:exodeoxyribonuclease V alpha subunit